MVVTNSGAKAVVICGIYEKTLRRLQRREKSLGLEGWSLLRGKD